MIYKDEVYGDVVFKEKVLVDLINTDLMKRLKGVNQGGPFVFVNPNHEFRKFKMTRFEHSVGVCILLKKFNSSPEEQIAGLLHDVSHTVFSHAVDFLFNRNTQHDYHELFHDEMILNSDIPSILKRYGFNVHDILDEKRYTLLEREIPDLCADRIDYFFRFMLEYEKITKKQIDDIFNAFLVHDNEIIFSDINQARFFAEKFIEANTLIWCTPLQASLFHTISEILRIAISKGIITKEDLFTTDDEVINKLKSSGDEKIKELLDLIHDIEVIEANKDYDLHLKSKVRYTDPKILIDDKISRLSEVDETYKKLMEIYISDRSRGFFVKIIKKEN